MYRKYVEIRNLHGLRDSDVSKATGIPKSTFSDWKSGRSNTKMKKLKQIANLFELSLEDFLKESEVENMNNLKIFENKEFGTIRTISIENEPWFVGKDIAKALGYGDGKSLNNAVSNHVDQEDKGVTEIMTPGGKQNMTIINESGLYSLILGSKLESAKRFKRWVTSEVLPSIRKHGGYISGQDTLSDDELMARALQVAQRKIEERDKVIEQQSRKIELDKPKTIFADAVKASETSILIGDLAKIISQNGVSIGQNRLFEWLRENGYLIKYGNSRNMPTQRSMEMGLFEIKESTHQNPDGSVRITRTPKVTGKGQIYFINKFLGKK